ncbi:phospholipase D active site motif domain-containing protein [Sarocladium implicatum]|nr:phospholipase D active site motif domain-containing protein [Sarocladium implicatum]
MGPGGQSPRDVSVSPMTRSPRSATPVDGAAKDAQFPTKLKHNVPPVIVTGTPGTAASGVSTASHEAADYWNGGSPHEAAAPVTNGLTPISTEQQAPLTGQTVAKDFSPTEAETENGKPPVGRRSVQLSRPEPPATPGSHTRHGSWDDAESPSKSRSTSFMNKIKSLAGNSSLSIPRSPSASPAAQESGSQSALATPIATRSERRLPPSSLAEVLDADMDADADAEETADEQAEPGPAAPATKKKRRMRRSRKPDRSAPTTPRLKSDHGATAAYNRLLRRRASMPDTSGRSRVLSDDEAEEARDQLGEQPWRPGSSYAGGSARVGEDGAEPGMSSAVGRRRPGPGHTRRTTVFGGGGVSDGDAMSPRRPFFTSERASTYGATKWKQVKNTLKLLRQKKEDRFDYYKSAELMAELRAGAPAVLMLASMIQRDEHGNKRIPVLLEQLKLRIKDSIPMPDDDKERHWIFTIELEYGSGPSRMGWTVTRTIRDIYNLHFRYRFAMKNEKYIPGRLDLGARPKQPKFPYSAFPYLRGARKQGDESDDGDQTSIHGEDTAGEMTAGDVTPQAMASDAEGPGMPPRRRSRARMLGMRRRSTGLTDPGETSNAEGPLNAAARRQKYVDKQRRILEKYLSEMIRWLMFRADSNRLCRFLELSALGVRLAAEGSYHGKEGYLHIQSSKGLDFRRVMTPTKVIARHSRKWFLVRQSYIVCVESPENMNIYDVYLVDSKFSIVSKRNALKQIASDDKKAEIDLTVESPTGKHHTLTLNTSERKVRLFSRNQAVMRQFEDSISEMLKQTIWYQPKRFNSFAPVRQKVFAQWLVDGRDYMWNVSRAINMARDVIYIHDWWLSPELYMRRPAAISQKWRLDRLLQKKAREGVKIFVIIYRNVEAAIPIDSEYTKFSLLNLHPNIFVQRSPNQFKKNQYFYAHHEKICVVDHDVAFVGGIDLCFGRWDCPQHPVTDDKPTGFEMTEQPKDAEHCQLFPGKDYSNPRVQDFFQLDAPYAEMYDRAQVPRMPWHDISMQVVGQPARDLTRHFVQRWNYLRRGRKPTRPLPFLLPAPDAKVEELEALGLTGTCEVQILRSATTWSLGIDSTEQSIQTAYVKMIEDSEHFVYMENQFFITSTDVNNTRITNRIGDALVDRIIRAHQNDEDWRCVIIIPLMPGFQNTVDSSGGTSVRLILMCQYRSICRGDQSIFGRLRALGIDPEEYIQFFSLRQWGILGSGALVTEQLYIHAKTIIVDDRVALIGSANINERSMRGDRDSECAAIVRDTDMIWSTMAGKPYRVGRFAYTLRLRLMREHLGLDVDEILEQERQHELEREDFEKEMEDIYREDTAPTQETAPNQGSEPRNGASKLTALRLPSFNNELDYDRAATLSDAGSVKSSHPEPQETDPRITGNVDHELDVSGYGADRWKSAAAAGLDEGRDSVIVNGREVLVNHMDAEGKGTLDQPQEDRPMSPSSDNRYIEPSAAIGEGMPPMPPFDRRTTAELGLLRANQLPTLPIVDDTDIGGPAVHYDPVTGQPTSGAFHPMAADVKTVHIDKDCMRDPLDPDFIDEIWNRAADNNTKLYRRVFRCMPDSQVSTWAEYREYTDYGERFRASMGAKPRTDTPETSGGGQAPDTAAAAGVGAPGPQAIAKAAENELEKIPDKMAEKVPHPHLSHDSANPKLPAANDEAVIDEKQATAEADATQNRPQQPGALDTSISAPRQAAGETTPVHSPADTPFPALDTTQSRFLEPGVPNKERDRRTTFSTMEKPVSRETNNAGQFGSMRRRRRATTKGSRRGFSIDDMPTPADAEELLKLVQGNLVQFPYDWLLTEEQNGNWGYQVDGVSPLAI